ncbi:MAG: alpha/beta hydrolase, partial [Candidatus Acidiferrales bacterium]
MKWWTIATLLLAGTLGTAIFSVAAARSNDSLPLDPELGITTIPIWRGHIPGSKGSPTIVPTLTVFAPSKPNGTAVIVAPGGAYVMLAS